MLFKKTISLMLCVIMLTCAVLFGQSALYGIAFSDSDDNDIDYITPEDFGAAGDGVSDDTDAIERCMKSETKEVYLTGEYLISRYIFSPYEKHFFRLLQRRQKSSAIFLMTRRRSLFTAHRNSITSSLKALSREREPAPTARNMKKRVMSC